MRPTTVVLRNNRLPSVVPASRKGGQSRIVASSESLDESQRVSCFNQPQVVVSPIALVDPLRLASSHRSASSTSALPESGW